MKSNFILRSIFTAFLLFSAAASAQNVSGTLVDNSTQKTIPFATVQLGENYGVVTNQEGNFSINTAGFSEKDSLIFSSMGYDRKAIALKDFENGTVYLTKNVEELGEVLLLDEKLTALEVMEKVNENLAKNYNDSLIHFTVFKRYKNTSIPYQMRFDFKDKRDDFLDKKAIREINHSMDSLNRAMQNKTTSYYNSELVDVYFGESDSTKTRIVKAVTLVNEEESTSMENLQENVFGTLLRNLKSSNTFKVRTGIIPIEDSLDMNEILIEEEEIDSAFASPSQYRQHLSDFGFDEKKGMGFVTQLDDYEYTIEDISTFNGELVYVISFQPDAGLFAGNGKMSGTMYVSADSFAVLMADYRFAEGEHGFNLNLKFIAGVAFKEKGKSGKIIFQKNKNGKYIPKYLRKQRKAYVFFERNFVFKENDERDDRMKIKFEMTIEMDQNATQEWLVVANEKITKAEFDAAEIRIGVQIQEISKYNPEIWKEYNILAPTEAIREYEY
ncbi:MAG TPA: carboxypeptidase-like regulatory domain-containing protein [Flavobacteriaceae bacterium]|nr:carboxypeptidase-like regulatory domain-containing protein [Flavobacteriaceae bacterium]